MIVLGAGAVSRGMRLGGGSDGLSCRNAQANIQAVSKLGNTALKLAQHFKHSKCIDLLQEAATAQNLAAAPP